MKAPFSSYLTGIAPSLKSLISELRKDFEYVSVLATDSTGFSVQISQRVKRVSTETMMTERGIVLRMYRGGAYSEYALNEWDPDRVLETAREVRESVDAQLRILEEAGDQVYDTPCLPDEPAEVFAEMETGRLPETEDIPALISRLSALSDLAMEKGRDMLDAVVRAQSTHVCKMFLSANRDLRQSYVYSEGSLLAMVSRDRRTVYDHAAVSGRQGPEIFDGLEGKLDGCLKVTEDLLGAGHVEPGMWDVITSPEVSGLIAHEACGHGVEMDMFVKNRALGQADIGRRVGSDLVTMHEGALCTENVASYAFDDEGTLAGDVTEIDRGILKTGICDALSALRLGTEPTGNGKRQNFEHKVYTRMTNTLFSEGSDTLDDMVKSIRHGYLLCGMDSGMEDPKHWGIQCIISRGYEIRDGKLTGHVVAPVVMTGYVPDLLNSVSMVSGGVEVFGSGGCGKGHKEWVKVSDGGPYMKAKARLG